MLTKFFNALPLILMVIIIIGIGPLLYYTVKARDEARAACRAKGGEYHSGRDIQLCLKPDAIIK